MTVQNTSVPVKTRSERKKEIEKENRDKPANKKWAKARFHYSEVPGGTWSGRPNLTPERFVDGEVYERPAELFELLNENCRVVKRSLKKSGDSIGAYVRTNKYTPRFYFEILERFEKEV